MGGSLLERLLTAGGKKLFQSLDTLVSSTTWMKEGGFMGWMGGGFTEEAYPELEAEGRP